MSTESVYTCGLYLPGHDVHWIQARVSMRIETDPKREAARLKGAGPGHLVEVGPDGSLIVDIGGDVRRLWSHDPDRLERLAARK